MNANVEPSAVFDEMTEAPVGSVANARESVSLDVEGSLQAQNKELRDHLHFEAARSRERLIRLRTEIYRQRRRAEQAADREMVISRSGAYRIGFTLREGFGSLEKFLAFPGALWKALRPTGAHVAEANARDGQPMRERMSREVEVMQALNEAEGLDSALDYIDGAPLRAAEQAHLLTQLAKAIAIYSYEDAYGIGELACELEASPVRLKWLLGLHYANRAHHRARLVMERLPKGVSLSAAEQRIVKSLQEELHSAPPAATEEDRRQRLSEVVRAMPASLDALKTAIVVAYKRGGVHAASDVLLEGARHLPPRTVAARLIKGGKVLTEVGYEHGEYELAKRALTFDKSDGTWRSFFWAAQRVGAMDEAYRAIRRVERLYGRQPTPEQKDMLARLKASPAFQMSLTDLLLARRPPQIPVVPRRVAYLLHNSLPWSSGGYATRGHGVAMAMAQAGFETVVVTRPGFPLDIRRELEGSEVSDEDVIDGVVYRRIREPRRTGMTMSEYIAASADAVETAMREVAPSIVVAASNHLTALPALIAARRLGLPFIYEVRGFWEITRMSREEGYERQAAFRIQKHLESAVVREADYVCTLTSAMQEELVARGAKPERIGLLPNSCDPDRFVPRRRDQALAERLGIPESVTVIGYVGTFVIYEGLEDLAEACGMLKKRGIEFRLLMVGNENASGQTRGPISEHIVTAAQVHGYTDWLVMVGRVPHEEVESYYSLIDVCPFPRKPWPVCEMVSPMKPLEALSMEKAVVVSSVRALVDMIDDGRTGLVFTKGSVVALADALERALRDAPLRYRLGIEARTWVKQERTWKAIGERLGQICSALIGTLKDVERQDAALRTKEDVL